MRSMQKIFEIVSKHLFEQNNLAIDADGDCMYRDNKGNSCAVGCLIPDNLYTKDIEGFSLDSENGILFMKSELKEKIPELEAYRNMLGDLQRVHDIGNGDHFPENSNWTSTKKMRNALKEVGEKYNLKTKFLDKLSFKDR